MTETQAGTEQVADAGVATFDEPQPVESMAAATEAPQAATEAPAKPKRTGKPKGDKAPKATVAATKGGKGGKGKATAATPKAEKAPKEPKAAKAEPVQQAPAIDPLPLDTDGPLAGEATAIVEEIRKPGIVASKEEAATLVVRLQNAALSLLAKGAAGVALALAKPQAVPGAERRLRRVYWQEELARVMASACGLVCYPATQGSNDIMFVGQPDVAVAVARVFADLCHWADEVGWNSHHQRRLLLAKEGKVAEARGYKKAWFRSLVQVVATRTEAADKAFVKANGGAQGAASKAVAETYQQALATGKEQDRAKLAPIAGPKFAHLPGAQAGAEEGTKLRPAVASLEKAVA